MTRADRRERKRQQERWRSRLYRFGWYYGRELKTFGEPPKLVLYALGVLFLPVALLVGLLWVLFVKPALVGWRRLAKPS